MCLIEYNYPPKEGWIVVLYTEMQSVEVNRCSPTLRRIVVQYLPNQLDKNELKLLFVNLKLVSTLQTFRGFCQVHFYHLWQIQHENNFLANTDKPKFVAFLIFVGTTALFIVQISSFPKMSRKETPSWLRSQNNEEQRIFRAKDIPSYGEPIKTRAKIAIH